LPASFHPDEPTKLARLQAIVAGDLVLDYQRHPSFMLHSAALFAVAVARATGAVLDDVALLFSARVWVAVLGSLSCVAAYLATRWLTSAGFALVAALWLAVAPLPAVLSHHLKEDVPVTMWLLFGLAAILVLEQRGALRDYVVAGACAGAAMATKYVGGPMLLVPALLAALVALRPRDPAPRGRRWLGLALLLGVAAAVFFAIDFSLLVRPVSFERDFAREMDRLQISNPLLPLRRISVTARGLSVPLLVAAGAAALAVIRWPGRGRWLLGVTALVWFLFGVLCPYGGARYVCPFASVVPVLVLAAAHEAWQRVRVPLRGAIIAGLAAVMIPSAVQTWQLVDAMTPDTREQARDHVLAIAPAGSHLAVLASPSTNPPWPRLRYLVTVLKPEPSPIDLPVSCLGADVVVTSAHDDPPRRPLPQLVDAWQSKRRFTAPSLPDATHNPRLEVYRLDGGPRPDVTRSREDVDREHVDMVIRRWHAHAALREWPRADGAAPTGLELTECRLDGLEMRWVWLAPAAVGESMATLRAIFCRRGGRGHAADLEMRGATLPAAEADVLIRTCLALARLARDEQEIDADARLLAPSEARNDRQLNAQTPDVAFIDKYLLLFSRDEAGVQRVPGISPAITAELGERIGAAEARKRFLAGTLPLLGASAPPVDAALTKRLVTIATEHPFWQARQLALVVLSQVATPANDELLVPLLSFPWRGMEEAFAAAVARVVGRSITGGGSEPQVLRDEAARALEQHLRARASRR
jgi:hypothetical protein